MDNWNIDIDSLRSNMYEDSLGAAFGGGFGGAFLEADNIKNASPQELLDMARDNGIDLGNYCERR